MRDVGLILGLGLVLSAGTAQAYGLQFDNSAWDRVLKKFVTKTGRVDYAALKATPGDLDQYVKQLAARSPISDPNAFPTRDSRLAYWINAYNALVMKGVIDHWPISSVRKVSTLPYSFFWREKFVAGGQKYTLDGIEGILRKKLAEPRIHFAIVCASNSCPRLQREAYTSENTERLLDEAARFYVNEPRNVRIDAAHKRVTLAFIFGHYHGDFEDYARARNNSATGQLVLDYIRIYANPKNRAALDTLKKPTVDHFSYDWGINDVNAPMIAAKYTTKENEL